MKFNRSAGALVVCLFACSSIALSLNPEETEYKLQENGDDLGHKIHRRAIRIYSKPPGDDVETYMGWNPRKHVDNVLQGGKIGVEVDTDRFTRKFSPIWRGIKKFRESRKRKWEERSQLPVDFPEDRGLGDDPDLDIDPRIQMGKEKDWQKIIECENDLNCREAAGQL